VTAHLYASTVHTAHCKRLVVSVLFSSARGFLAPPSISLSHRLSLSPDRQARNTENEFLRIRAHRLAQALEGARSNVYQSFLQLQALAAEAVSAPSLDAPSSAPLVPPGPLAGPAAASDGGAGSPWMFQCTQVDLSASRPPPAASPRAPSAADPRGPNKGHRVSFADEAQGESQQQQPSAHLNDGGKAAAAPFSRPGLEASPSKPAGSNLLPDAHQLPLFFSPQDGDAFGSSIGLPSAPTQGVGEAVSQPLQQGRKRGENCGGLLQPGAMAETQIEGALCGVLTEDEEGDEDRAAADVERGEGGGGCDDQQRMFGGGLQQGVEGNGVVSSPPGVDEGRTGGVEGPGSEWAEAHPPEAEDAQQQQASETGGGALQCWSEEQRAGDSGMGVVALDGDENSADGLLEVRSQGSVGKRQRVNRQPSEDMIRERGALDNLSNLQRLALASGCSPSELAAGEDVGSFTEGQQQQNMFV